MAAQNIRAKDANPDAIRYNAWDSIDFDTIVLGSNVANTTVSASYPIGIAYKIQAIAAVLTGTVAGSCSFNIVSGTAAENGVAPQDSTLIGTVPSVVAANGNQLFTADTALTMTANIVQMFYPQTPQWDSIFGAGTLLTVRLATGAATTGNLKIVAYAIPVNRYVQLPNAYNPYIPSAAMI